MARKKENKPTRSSRLPSDYPQLLESLKQRVRRAQTRAVLSANRVLIQLYWDIGREIALRQEEEGWGAGVIEHLGRDIQTAFPGIRGFSARNIHYMRAFYLTYSKELTNLQQPVAEIEGSPVSGVAPPPTENAARPVPQRPLQGLSEPVTDLSNSTPPQPLAGIPWGHNVILLQKLDDSAERLWYAGMALEHGWSRAVLTAQIESDLYRRKGRAISNFAQTLPPPQSDLAQQSLKDPYVFDFLALHDDAVERDLELGLVDHIQRFLIELGAGFAFVGRQVHLCVGDDDFYLDLLFYHLQLRCFVVIDLKMRKFTPEDVGKMNFYLSAVDAQMRHPHDAPSIGLVLCKERDRITAEYALRDMAKPIGVAEWKTQFVAALPESLQGRLPSVEEIEKELSKLECEAASAHKQGKTSTSNEQTHRTSQMKNNAPSET